MKNGSKLKSETSRDEAMKKKLRSGKADIRAETKEEKKYRDKLRVQTKKKNAARYTQNSVSTGVHSSFSEANQDDNAGGDAVNAGTQAGEKTLYSRKVKSHDKQTDGYGKKLHQKDRSDVSSASKQTSKELHKNRMKKEIQRNAINQRSREAANGTGNLSKKFVDKAEDMVGRIAEAVTEFTAEHPLAFIIVGLIMMVVLVISGAFTSCSMTAGGVGNMTLDSSFTAQDGDITAVDANYGGLEQLFQTTIDNIETIYPGFDEYNYDLDEIGHDSFELAALLTVLYEDYTPSEVQTGLESILNSQYEYKAVAKVETRTRTVTKWHWVIRTRTEVQNGETVQVSYQSYEPYQAEEEYQYYILNVSLTNYGIDYLARNAGLTDEQLERYEVLLATKGNKAYLFEDMAQTEN